MWTLKFVSLRHVNICHQQILASSLMLRIQAFFRWFVRLVGGGFRSGRFQRDGSRRDSIVSATARWSAVVRRQRLPLSSPVHLRRRPLSVPTRSAHRRRQSKPRPQCPHGNSRRRSTGIGTLLDSELFLRCALFGRVVIEIRERTQTDKQTNRHTDTLIAILRTPTGGRWGGEVIVVIIVIRSKLIYCTFYKEPQTRCVCLRRRL